MSAKRAHLPGRDSLFGLKFVDFVGVVGGEVVDCAWVVWCGFVFERLLEFIVLDFAIFLLL